MAKGEQAKLTTEVQMELDLFEANRERNQGLIETRLQALDLPHQIGSRPSAKDLMNAHPVLAMVSTFRIHICLSSSFFGKAMPWSTTLCDKSHSSTSQSGKHLVHYPPRCKSIR